MPNHSSETIDLFVPGRLCLFGEHSDWAGSHRRLDSLVEPGLCLLTGTDQGLFGRAEPLEDAFHMNQVAPDGSIGPGRYYPAVPALLREQALSGSFDSYAAGTAAVLMEDHGVQGLRLQVHKRTLPLKKGLSSSAAVCVLTARAFNLVYDLGLSVEAEMDLAYRGELLTGSECGRMDQACAFGTGRPVLLTIDGDSVVSELLEPGGEFHYLVVDLKGSKNTRRILKELNRAFLNGDEQLRDALGPTNRRITVAAGKALKAGDAEALGDLMEEAQEVFDGQVAPVCPEELKAPLLHGVLKHPALPDLAWGAKGVGSQGDGAAQILCRGEEEKRLLAGILEAELGVVCLGLGIGVNAKGRLQSRPDPEN